jgi:xanthine dehydrogenase accessory factor
MIPMDLFDEIAALRRTGESFAVATVVARRAPVSAHLGDTAIVHADGRMEGFVGGACSCEIIRRQALESIRTRCARLVSIRPDANAASASTSEHVVVSMTCVSEGAVDVYVEPFVRPRRLVVVGSTPVADALARLARSMNYEVLRAVDAHEQRDIERQSAALGITVVALDALETIVRDGPPDQAAVVASQGHYDEESLASIVGGDVSYVGLVASRKRGEPIRARLAASDARRADAIHIPAGLDLGARTPPEVALSILAEIVKQAPSGAPRAADAGVAVTAHAPAAAATAVDPVCGMDVEIATARHVAEVDGALSYFCCAGCRARFVEDPARFRAPAPR